MDEQGPVEEGRKEEVKEEESAPSGAVSGAGGVEQKRQVEVGVMMPNHVLPPRRYKLKVALMLSDLFAFIVFVYFFMIRSILRDVRNDTFSFISNRMFSFYCVLGITIGLGIFVLIFKTTRSVRTRFERENEVRQNPNIKVWLTGYDWGWPILFLPTVALMAGFGVVGILLGLIFGEATAVKVILDVMGGVVIVFGAVNTAVVIFKLRPVVLGLMLLGLVIMLLVLLLHGPGTFVNFFKGFRYLGFTIEPWGYLILAYVWSVFLRIIWIRSLFFYWVFVPNRLELQHGLSESNDSVDRDDLRHQIDTDDVILRWWNVGVITFYFPELDRLPVTNVIVGIRKKAVYANRIASVKTMQD
ncbi:MAG: hypothetical protein ACYTE8_12350 [Planctomycetota bacterium]|jgi:hypothetical protein